MEVVCPEETTLPAQTQINNYKKELCNCSF